MVMKYLRAIAKNCTFSSPAFENFKFAIFNIPIKIERFLTRLENARSSFFAHQQTRNTRIFK